MSNNLRVWMAHRGHYISLRHQFFSVVGLVNGLVRGRSCVVDLENLPGPLGLGLKITFTCPRTRMLC